MVVLLINDCFTKDGELRNTGIRLSILHFAGEKAYWVIGNWQQIALGGRRVCPKKSSQRREQQDD